MSTERHAILGAEAAASRLEWAESAAPEILGPHRQRWLALVEAEQAALHDALVWFVEHGQGDEAVRLAAALWRYWHMQGQLAEGRALLRRALDVTPGIASKHRAEALYGAGLLAFRQGDNAACRSLSEESLAIAREIGDDRATALALIGLCRAALRDEDPVELQEFAQESLRLSQAIGDERLTGSSWHMLAESAHMTGDLDLAERYYAENLATSRRLNDATMVQVELYNLGQLARHQGRPDKARSRLRESLRMALADDDTQAMAYCLAALAGADIDAYPERAACWLGAANGEFERRFAVPDPADQVDFEATAAELRRTLGEDAFAAAHGSGRGRSVSTVAAEALASAHVTASVPSA